MAVNLHIEAMAWLRYTKQLPLVCTEVGRWNADVLGVGPKYSIEVEVKKSVADLRADFRGKRTKHYYYAQGGGYRGTAQVPNYLYYIVTEDLRDKALKVLESLEVSNLVGEPQTGARSYGLLWVPNESFGRPTDSTGFSAGKNVQTARRATCLHKDVPAGSLVTAVTRRLSSELVGLYQMHERLERNLKVSLEDIRDEIRSVSSCVAGFVPEPPEPTYEEETANEAPAASPHPPE